MTRQHLVDYSQHQYSCGFSSLVPPLLSGAWFASGHIPETTLSTIVPAFVAPESLPHLPAPSRGLAESLPFTDSTSSCTSATVPAFGAPERLQHLPAPSPGLTESLPFTGWTFSFTGATKGRFGSKRTRSDGVHVARAPFWGHRAHGTKSEICHTPFRNVDSTTRHKHGTG